MSWAIDTAELVGRTAMAGGGHFGRGPGAERCGDEVDLKMSQGELALLLGASRPKVNVALGVLAKAMAITRKGKEILCHPAALCAFAGME